MTHQVRDDDSHPITFAQGFIVGACLGALLTLWYTPRTGRQTLAQAQVHWQGESIEQALQQGRDLAHRHRAQQAHPQRR
jgi:hypothetical protein